MPSAMTSAGAIARGLFIALLLAAAASVDAMSVPTKWAFNGGLEDKKIGGGEVQMKKNGKVVVRPRRRPRALRTTPSTYKPKNKAGGSPLTVTPAEGSYPADPNGAWYTVSWSGITLGNNQGAGDRIAVLIGNTVNTGLHPVKYVFASQVAPDTYASGYGSTLLWLPFLRSPVTIAYITENPDFIGIWNKFLVAGGDQGGVVINPGPALVPHNIKLTYISNRTEIGARVVWQTVDVGKTTVNMQVQYHLYGTPVDALGSGKAAARLDTYKASDMCSSPAIDNGFMTPGSVWVADMANLTPGKKYSYRVGDATSNTWSPWNVFMASPADAVADPSTEARILLTADAGQYAPDNAYMPDGNLFEFLSTFVPGATSAEPGQAAYCGVKSLLADVGSGPGQQPATKEVYMGVRSRVDAGITAQKDYHAYFLNGDIAYARGEAHQWDTWQWAMSPILTRVPALYTPGNHEADDKGTNYPDLANFTKAIIVPDGGGECNVPYRKLLQTPRPSGPTSDWYSVTIGPVYVIQLNSEQNLAVGSNQYNWLVKELASVDRKKTPWLIVSMHRPMYVDTIQLGDQNAAWAIRNSIEPLLVAAQVDMVWAGHIHAYQRSCLGGVVKGTCQAPVQGPTSVGSGVSVQPKAPVYVLTGNAGFQAPIDLFQKPPGWQKGAVAGDNGNVTYEYGFSDVAATATQLTFTSYVTRGKGDYPTVYEQFVLTKPAGWTNDTAAGKALYESVTTSDNILPNQPIDMGAYFGSLVITYGRNSDSNDVQSTWFTTNCQQKGQALYDLVTPAPGVKTQWAVRDVWYASTTFLNFLNTYVGNSFLAPMNDFRTNNAYALNYFTTLMQPGNRGYFGP